MNKSEFTLLLSFEIGCFRRIICKWRSQEFQLGEHVGRVSWERLTDLRRVEKVPFVLRPASHPWFLTPTMPLTPGTRRALRPVLPGSSSVPVSSWTGFFLQPVGDGPVPTCGAFPPHCGNTSMSDEEAAVLKGRRIGWGTKAWYRSTGTNQNLQDRDTSLPLWGCRAGALSSSRVAGNTCQQRRLSGCTLENTPRLDRPTAARVRDRERTQRPGGASGRTPCGTEQHRHARPRGSLSDPA